MIKTQLNNTPFAPKKFPFFYGWVILLMGTIGVVMSSPGQTAGISAFTEYLLKAFHITRNELSTCYLIGTVLSSLSLTQVGKLYDRIGARWLAVITAIMLGLVLFFMSQADRMAFSMARWLGMGSATFIFSLAVLCLGIFMLRLSGQGALTMVSRNMIMKWFVRKRGLTGGISNVFTALAFSLAPSVFNHLINQYGWREAWMISGAFILVVFSLLAFVFFRDNPEDCELQADGDDAPIENENPDVLHKAQKQFRLKEAKQSYIFWIYAISLSMYSLLVTGFTFHIESIFANVGMDKETAFFVFVPASFVSILFTLVGGYISDRVKLKYFLLIYLVALCGLSASIVYLSPGLSYYTLIACYGVATSFYSLLMSVAWPRFFGRQYLGEISGFTMSLVVFFSAVGPITFSLALSLFGSYSFAAGSALAVALICLVGAFKANNPQEKFK